ncbi:MAG: NADH-quinone oxidoreductase subunit B family protein [Candidatus Hodarchaeales archaeon]
MPVKVAFMQLSSCWGCHQSLLNAHLELLPILPKLDIVYWPAVVDYKLKSLEAREDGEIVVGFLEGVIRTKKDKENVQLMREKCAIIVAIGACPCYGSVAGLANLYDIDELISRKFIQAESITTENPEVPTKNVPGFEDYIVNAKKIIDVDVFIPGCPPTTDNIVASISYLLTLVGDGPTSLNKEDNICRSCDLKNDGCFLNNEQLCYGSITATGCDLMCPNNGDICYGCFRATNKLDNKVEQLKELIYNTDKLSTEQAASLQHFLDLYLGVSNITNFYYRGDLLQRLAYEPESFKLSEVQTKKGLKFALDVAPTGNKTIDGIIGTSLYLLKGDVNFKFSTKSVCSHCGREIADKVPTDLKRDYDGLPTMDTCFLEQGYICIGPVTQAGCGTICPNKANAPCLGCYGAATGIEDPGIKFISTLGSLSYDKDPDELMSVIKDPAGLFNRFTLAASSLGHKYHDKMEDE